MPASMAPSQTKRVRLSDLIIQAAEKFCADNGEELSELLRRGLCKEIGRPDLIDTVAGRGRPKKAPAKKKPKK